MQIRGFARDPLRQGFPARVLVEGDRTAEPPRHTARLVFAAVIERTAQQ
jgi:hypothetical protein